MNKLKKAVQNYMKLDDESFKDEMEDVRSSPFGAAIGFTNFCYFSDTDRFYSHYRKLILRELVKSIDDTGKGDLFSVIKGFSSLTGDETNEEIIDTITDHAINNLVSNSLAWWALEHVAWEMKVDNEEE